MAERFVRADTKAFPTFRELDPIRDRAGAHAATPAQAGVPEMSREAAGAVAGAFAAPKPVIVGSEGGRATTQAAA